MDKRVFFLYKGKCEACRGLRGGRLKRTEFDIKISIKDVCRFLDIREESEAYEELTEELEEMLPLAYEKIEPKALLGFGSLEGYTVEEDGKQIKEALFGVFTIGKKMGEWSTQLFAEGDYMRGMMADAIADNYLFQMDTAMEQTVVDMCRKKGKGIVRRVEAPQDIPMSIQKRAYDAVGAEREGIGIKSSFMYDPVKTVCQVYLLDDDTSHYHPEHDCSRCGNLTCKNRRIPFVTVKVRIGEKEKQIQAKKSESLLEAFQKQDIFLPAVCAGRGSCGKCRVRFLEGAVEPGEADRKVFTEEELKQGWRLACRAYPEQECTILLDNAESDFYVLADAEEGTEKKLPDGRNYGIAADIGTTTIAMQLVDLSDGKTADVYTAINRQRAYGADVISRIDASNNGKREELRNSIRQDLLKGVEKLTEGSRLKISRMVIGANTTMVHLLMGYSCETLGVYPFEPVNIDTIHISYRELLGDAGQDCPVTVYPGISTYVGGDIVSGLYTLEFAKREKPAVLIDLGTNGEMAVGCRDGILTASTAAGPAFEGGNITCGTGSIPGAICSAVYKNGRMETETINHAKPAGICGTGIIDVIYELKKAEIIDETGLMEEPYFQDGVLLSEEGNLRFYQKDVREIQLAKAAVRAGLETLVSRYGISCEEVDRFYIAGGFGYKMNIQKAVNIGLLPTQCGDRTEAVGNSCLQGSIRYLLNPGAEKETEALKAMSRELPLSNDKMFQELYMEYMYFE